MTYRQSIYDLLVVCEVNKNLSSLKYRLKIGFRPILKKPNYPCESPTPLEFGIQTNFRGKNKTETISIYHTVGTKMYCAP